MTTSPNMLREADAASWLGISKKTLANWRVLRQGPPFYKIGKAVRYRRDDLEAFVDAAKKEFLE